MTFRFVLTAIVLSSSLIISGCIGSQRAYEGISRAPEEIAVVKGSGSPTDERILIDVADGKSFNPSVTEVEVLPGQRKLTVRYVDMAGCFLCLNLKTYSYSEVVVFDAKAGHTYQFHGEGSWEDRPEPIELRLIDTETNEVVWQTEIDSNRPTYIINN